MLFQIFHMVIGMSCVASFVAMVLALIKYVLQRLGCPRKIMFLLWAVIAFRLTCPFAPSTDLSTFNIVKIILPTASESVAVSEALHEKNVVIYSVGIPGDDKQSIYSQSGFFTSENKELIGFFAAAFWLAGMCFMLIFGMISYLRLKKCMRFAVKLKENIYISDNVHTSFILGVFRPKIFISDNVSEHNLSNIILHEKTHIRRRDHISKIVGYIILALHWFNPVVWLMFKMFSEDMELSCDESVISEIGQENKRYYINSLLQAALNKKRTIFFCSVCFSANPTKRRVKNMIKFKKHSKLLSIIATLSCVFLLVAFGTNATQEISKGNEIINAYNNEEQKGVESVYISGDNAGISDEAPENEKTEIIVADKKQPAKPVENVDVQKNISKIAHEENSDADGEKVKIKAEHNPEVDGIDLEQIILSSETDMQSLENRLNSDGVFESDLDKADLRKNYVISKYSFNDELKSNNYNVMCDENGNISLYFDINTDNYVDVTFCDAETKEVIAEYGVLANSVNVYSFMGFDTDKEYDVILRGQTYGDWKVEGEYIIY